MPTEPAGSDRNGIWWRPDRLAWWIGVLFAIGSTLFLVPGLGSISATPEWTGPAFFAGSIFFTVASALQLLAATEVPHRGRPGNERAALRPRGWMPHHVDWVSALIQLPGTVLFNVNTFDGMRDLIGGHADFAVWTPDMIGSACFLASSLLAFANTEHEWLSFRPGDIDWRIAALNLAGSLAFGVSALASYVRPATDQQIDAALAPAATAVGAACFLAGALLLLPQAERQRATLSRSCDIGDVANL